MYELKIFKAEFLNQMYWIQFFIGCEQDATVQRLNQSYSNPPLTRSALRSRLGPEIGSTCLLCPYLNCLWSHTTFYISRLFTADDTQSTLNVSLATELKGKKRQVETEALHSVHSHAWGLCSHWLCTDCFTVSHPNIKRPGFLYYHLCILS